MKASPAAAPCLELRRPTPNTASHVFETLVNMGNTGCIRAAIGVCSYSAELSGPLSDDKMACCVGSGHR